MLDVQLLRLQYEVLNVSAEAIAHMTGLPLDIIVDEITCKGWTRLWPDEDEPALTISEGEDGFKLSSDRYIEKSRKRLQAYTLAKEIILSTRYLDLEAGLVSKANECLQHIDAQTGVSAVKALSSLWKDMTKDKSTMASMQMTVDDTGLPTVIIKDLSGRAL